ncbi:MAG: hypothetical protein ABFD89_05200 [Bryobacteraceae bacterium]
MQTANIKARDGEAAERFPRSERGVCCREEVGLRRPPRDRMLRADRHITKRELAEIAARPEVAR